MISHSASTLLPTAKVPNTALGRMYEEHIRLILEKDVEGLLDQYAEDAVLISSFMRKPVIYRGRNELREHFQGILAIEGLQTEIAFWAETENPQTLMIVEAIQLETKDGQAAMRFADNWVLENGRIKIHFAGMVQYSDGSIA
jgi:ketosteroid isomerase-like protein